MSTSRIRESRFRRKIIRTLDRGMNKGCNRPISTLPVDEVDAVPMGPIGYDSGRWEAGSQRRTGGQRRWWSSVQKRRFMRRRVDDALVVLVQLHHLQANIIHGSINHRAPLLE